MAAGACPYLGMVGDPRSHHTFPSRLHLCQAGEPAHIGLGFQADYCLGGLYPSCARYQRAEEAAAAGVPLAGTAAVAGTAAIPTAALAAAGADGSPPTVPASPPMPAPSASYGRVSGGRDGGAGRTSPLVTVLLGLATVAVVFAFAAAAGFLKFGGGGPIAAVTTAPASTSPTTQPSASATTAATPSPTPAQTASPTTAPTGAPTTAPTTQPTNASGEVEYTVKTGDTLFSIGLQFDVPWPDIAARNGLEDPYVIHVGDVLIIPIGGIPSASPGESPSATSFIYIVVSGDRLSTIATKFHVTQQAILDANPDLTDPDKIFAGQQLVIPAAEP
jgi:LysM repeat protein